MSATSVKIYGNDMALDVKEDFISLYGIGKSIDEINEYILKYQPDDDDEEACAFWSALAFVEWEYGVLQDTVKSKTRYIIENYSDAELFLKQSDAEKRTLELQGLLIKLDTVNPKPKKRKRTFVYRTLWKEGDILAIPINGKYVYLHVCGVSRSKEEIKELEEDSVFVRVFDVISDSLLGADYFKSGIKYKNLDPYKKCTAKWLWCVGVREKNALEKKVTCIGRLLTEHEVKRSVYTDFQFCKVEDTLRKMFKE